MNEHICSSCSHSIFCPTWAEWKCKLKKQRIYSDSLFATACSDRKKRGKDFKESKYQCEDCLKNEKLNNDEE